MKKLGLFAFAFALLGASSPATTATPAPHEGADLSTDRRVHGLITSVDPEKFTIESTHHAVTGKIDAHTKVTINGRPAKLSDLQPASHAKGEVCLDQIWVSIDAH